MQLPIYLNIKLQLEFFCHGVAFILYQIFKVKSLKVEIKICRYCMSIYLPKIITKFINLYFIIEEIIFIVITAYYRL